MTFNAKLLTATAAALIGAIALLNADGDAVEGPMADLYVLKKDQ